MKEIIKHYRDTNLFQSQNDHDFFHRVFNNGNLDKYLDRLKAIDALDHDNVLDAGCGYGQWSFALSQLNKNICSFDIESHRIKIANEIKNKSQCNNISFTASDNPLHEYKCNYFDFIFSYGVIQCTDYIKTLEHYFKLLKPGGKLYFTGADLGWFLYYIIDTHNDTKDYSTRDWGIDTLDNTINYFSDNLFNEGSNVITPYKTIDETLNRIGFSNILKGPDGSIKINKDINIESFFPFQKYGKTAIYEVLCSKP